MDATNFMMWAIVAMGVIGLAVTVLAEVVIASNRKAALREAMRDDGDNDVSDI